MTIPEGDSRPADNASRNRSGAVYITVLFTALIVAIVTLTGLQLLTRQSRTTQASLDATLARHATQTGFEVALARIANDPNWKTNHSSGVKTQAREIATGDTRSKHSFTYALTSPTGNFSNIGGRTLTLTSYGQVGESLNAAKIDLLVNKVPSPALDYTLFSRGWIFTHYANSSIATDGKILAGAGPTNSEVIEADSITTDSQADRTPFDWKSEYQTLGTQVSRWTFPAYGYNRKLVHRISRELYSPASNPRTGRPDPNGIYWIDCEGNDFEIKNSRFLGTLVLINCRTLWISGPIVMESISPEYPAILCNGDIYIGSSTEFLKEEDWSTGIWTNFNPSHTPYHGQSDNDWRDSYPSIIRGLVHATGHIFFSNYDNATGSYKPVTPIEGIVGTEGNCYVPSSINITFDPRIRDNPPSGFCDASTVTPIPQTFRYVDSDSPP